MNAATALSAAAPSAADLDGFRRAQKLAYDCAVEVAADLEPGVTEREAAQRLRRLLEGYGVHDGFHEPFAWFGDRTAFRGAMSWRAFRGFSPAFYPGERRLEPGMPFILDCAPVLDGYTADIGYSGALGHNAILDRLLDDLAEYRTLILDLVRERRPLAAVSRAVDALCVRHGVEPRHKAYPFQVLAHRVTRLDADSELPARSLFNFGLRNIVTLVRVERQARRQGWSPLWNSSRRSEHAPVPGLWAVEPHLGFRGVGAKFEELLVITPDDAYWLDDELPHVRRWRARGLAGAAA